MALGTQLQDTSRERENFPNTSCSAGIALLANASPSLTYDAGMDCFVIFELIKKLTTQMSLPGTGLLLTGLTKCRTSAGYNFRKTQQLRKV